jgi:hypothetical protein
VNTFFLISLSTLEVTSGKNNTNLRSIHQLAIRVHRLIDLKSQIPGYILLSRSFQVTYILLFRLYKTFPGHSRLPMKGFSRLPTTFDFSRDNSLSANSTIWALLAMHHLASLITYQAKLQAPCNIQSKQTPCRIKRYKVQTQRAEVSHARFTSDTSSELTSSPVIHSSCRAAISFTT